MEEVRTGLLNMEQLDQLKEAFRECDQDLDNFITPRELGWAMRVMGFNPTEIELQQLVNRVSLKMNSGWILINVKMACFSTILMDLEK